MSFWDKIIKPKSKTVKADTVKQKMKYGDNYRTVKSKNNKPDLTEFQRKFRKGFTGK